MPPRSTKLASGSMLVGVDLQHVGEQLAQADHTGLVGIRCACEVAHRLVVRLARRQHRQLRDGDGLHGAGGYAGSGGGDALDLSLVVTGGRHREAVVDIGAERRHTAVTQRRLDALEIDPQPVHLDETAAAPDHFVQAIGAAAGDVSGVQRFDGLAERQVGGPVCVAHHHVGAAVDQLADVVVVPRVARFDRERSAGDRPADRGRVRRGELRWQIGHSGGGLGRPIHHEQVPALSLPEFGESPHALGRHPAAGLRDVPQVRQIEGLCADTLEQFERVGHACERRARVPAEQLPELVVDDRAIGEDQARRRAAGGCGSPKGRSSTTSAGSLRPCRFRGCRGIRRWRRRC